MDYSNGNGYRLKVYVEMDLHKVYVGIEIITNNKNMANEIST